MTHSLLKPTGNFWVIIPAGGSGQRFSTSQDKLLAELGDQRVLWHSITPLLSHPWISGVVVVASAVQQAAYQALFETQTKLSWTTGGDDRRASVWQGLLKIPDTATHVVIHDAARPFLSSELIESVIRAATQKGNVGAIAALPIHDTVKQGQSRDPACIARTHDRSSLWRAQTPQVFNREILIQAHQHLAQTTPVTDDAQLIELAELGSVELVPSDSLNLKVTTPDDLRLARAYWELSQK
jgi:2-C-methyl-D-erythritol 4-phosphate cytidylyltransferase